MTTRGHYTEKEKLRATKRKRRIQSNETSLLNQGEQVIKGISDIFGESAFWILPTSLFHTVYPPHHFSYIKCMFAFILPKRSVQI